MKRIALLLGMVALWSCGTNGGPSAAPDWAAIESAQVVTGPIEFKPAIEPTDIRVPLFFFESSLIDRTSRVVAGRHPVLQPFGVDLGNGLAIDSGGSVFLDALKLLHIDTAGAYKLVSKADTLLGRAVTLKSDGQVTTFDSSRAKGTVVRTPTGYTLKSGKDNVVVVTNAEGVYSYTTQIYFDSRYEMKTTDGQLSIRGGPPITALKITREGEPVIFNDSADAAWPKYTVTKIGDSYSIEYRSDTVILVYKVYFVPGAVYLVSNGFVLLTVKITDSSILVNGKEVITYSRG